DPGPLREIREKFGSAGFATGLIINLRAVVVKELLDVITSARNPTSLSADGKLPLTFHVPRSVVFALIPVGSH
ncbi:MAG: hypothetical protein ACKO29_01345, partial [Actinomycetota bacterium]